MEVEQAELKVDSKVALESKATAMEDDLADEVRICVLQTVA